MNKTVAVVTDRETALAYERCDMRFFTSEEKVSPEAWKAYDSVYLMQPYTEQAVLAWTGHPHLRCVENPDELYEELAFSEENIELERKFLVRLPDEKALERYHPYCVEIEQIYLVCLNGTHRIRKRVSDGCADYFETLKIRLTGAKCREYEEKIDEETYLELQKRADPKKHPIRKKRVCFLYEKQYFELDIYDFWNDRATLELELRDDQQSVKLPPEIALIKDVTDDHRYKNNYLAGMTYEDYQTGLL